MIPYLYCMKLIECVPNFSEGRDKGIINKIAAAIKSVKKVELLHIDSGYDANRTVMTFVGNPIAVTEAAFFAMKTASELIDMSKHQGTHPRLGSTCVCPLIPFVNISMNELKVHVDVLSQRVGEELNIPVYLYAESSKNNNRYNQANIRKGEYEGLATKMMLPEWIPDYGPTMFQPKVGATVIGARDFLLAYNVNLDTRDVNVSKEIAKSIRSNPSPNPTYQLEHVKAIGWDLPAFNCTQVSMNLMNYGVTNMADVYLAIKKESEKYNVQVTGSELIGMIPLDAMLLAGKAFTDSTQEKVIVETTINELGLNAINPFIAKDRILEWKMNL